MVWVSPDTSVCASYVQHLSGYVCLFFRRHGDSRVRRISDIHQSYIYSKTTISSWSAYCKHLSESWKKIDSVSSTSVSSLGYASIKGENGISIQTFLICVIKLRLPPRLHVTRARPYQGGSWECWGPPWISTFETWNIYWEYIYVIFLHTDIHTNSLVLIRPAQPTQKSNIILQACGDSGCELGFKSNFLQALYLGNSKVG